MFFKKRVFLALRTLKKKFQLIICLTLWECYFFLKFNFFKFIFKFLMFSECSETSSNI